MSNDEMNWSSGASARAEEDRSSLINGLTTDQIAAGYLLIPHIAKDRDFREFIIACDKLLTVKGHDYTQGAEGDYGRLKNFYTGSEALGLTPLQVLGVYFKKHIDAVFTFIKKGQVESEPIEGRIYDCINYLLLLGKMVQYEKRKSAEPKLGYVVPEVKHDGTVNIGGVVVKTVKTP